MAENAQIAHKINAIDDLAFFGIDCKLFESKSAKIKLKKLLKKACNQCQKIQNYQLHQFCW